MMRRWLVAVLFLVWTPLLVASTFVYTAVSPSSVALAAATPSPTASPTDPSAGANCDADAMTWAICPIISGAADLVDGIMKDIIQPFLQVSPLTETIPGGGKNPAYLIWQNFRNVASVMMILVFFAIIFGTAIGFDNYTIKKTLPHLIAGAVLIPFSWYICAIMVDAGNIFGQGMLTLMDSFIPKPQIDFSTSLSVIMGLVAGGATVLIFLKKAGSEMGLAIIITILIAVLATMFTLVLRQILIIVLVVLSPFAFLAYILPNTQKLFDQWWKNLTRLILMYPLIMLIFEAGRIFAVTAGATFAVNGGGGGGGGTTDYLKQSAVPFLELAGLFLPLAAVPWTYKWAGSAMAAGAGAVGRLGGAANKRWGQGSDFGKKRAERKGEKGANAWMKTPVTRLGKYMQKTDENGDYIHKGLASMNQNWGAIRAGQSGIFPGMGPSTAQKRGMAGTAAKAQSDEVTAEAARAMIDQELKNGSYQEYDQRIKEATQSKLVAGERTARKEMLDRMQTRGLLDDVPNLTKLATGEQTNVAGFQGQIAREAAIKHLATIDEWGKSGAGESSIRQAWIEGKISDDMMRNGLDGVTGAASKARDIAINLGSPRDASGKMDDLTRTEKFEGRNAGHRLAFDKTTRWEDLNRASMLQARIAAGQTTYVDTKGNTVNTQDVLNKHRDELQDSYSKISQVAQDWSKLDNITAKRVAANAYGAATDIGFTPTQMAELQLHITPDGKAK